MVASTVIHSKHSLLRFLTPQSRRIFEWWSSRVDGISGFYGIAANAV